MKWLKALYFTFNVVLPLGVLAAAVILWSDSDLLKLWTLVGAIPLTAVYWGILFLNFSPRTKWDHFTLLLPFLLALGLALLTQRGKGLIESWVLEASAIYTGLTFCFFIGLNYLFFKKTTLNGPDLHKKVAGYFTFILLFVVLMGIPAIFFSSLVLSLDAQDSYEVPLVYFLQILFSLYSFYPKFVQLYREGKL